MTRAQLIAAAEQDLDAAREPTARANRLEHVNRARAYLALAHAKYSCDSTGRLLSLTVTI